MCAYCGEACEPETMIPHQFGSTCPKCVRLADAERMRANDEKPRTGRPKGGLPALVEALALASDLHTSAPSADYPRALALMAGNVEGVAGVWSVAGLGLSPEVTRAVEDLIWNIRTLSAELARAGNEIEAGREAAEAAARTWAMSRATKGGEA